MPIFRLGEGKSQGKSKITSRGWPGLAEAAPAPVEQEMERVAERGVSGLV